MNIGDRAEWLLYVTMDCGGPNVGKARGNVAMRLDRGKRPRSRDIRVLERAAQLAGNAPVPPVSRNEPTDPPGGRPGIMRAAVRRLRLARAVRRERRDFRKAQRNYRRHVIPMAEVGNAVIDSWYFLLPFGLLCSWLFVCIATAVSP